MNQVLESSLKEYHPFKKNLLIGHSMIYSMPTKTVTKNPKPIKKYHSFNTVKKK